MRRNLLIRVLIHSVSENSAIDLFNPDQILTMWTLNRKHVCLGAKNKLKNSEFPTTSSIIMGQAQTTAKRLPKEKRIEREEIKKNQPTTT